MTLTQIFIVALLIAMLGSLFSALWFMFRDHGQGTRTVKALTWRISIWIVLFLFLIGGIYTGLITPSNSLQGAGQGGSSSTANGSSSH